MTRSLSRCGLPDGDLLDTVDGCPARIGFGHPTTCAGLPLLPVVADDPFDVLPRHSQVLLALVDAAHPEGDGHVARGRDVGGRLDTACASVASESARTDGKVSLLLAFNGAALALAGLASVASVCAPVPNAEQGHRCIPEVGFRTLPRSRPA